MMIPWAARYLMAAALTGFGLFAVSWWSTRVTVVLVVTDDWADYAVWLAEDYNIAHPGSHSIEILSLPYDDLHRMAEDKESTKDRGHLVLVDSPRIPAVVAGRQASALVLEDGDWKAYEKSLCPACRGLMQDKGKGSPAIPVGGNAPALCTNTKAAADAPDLHLRIGSANAIVTDFLALAGLRCPGADETCIRKSLGEFRKAADSPSLEKQAFNESDVLRRLMSGATKSGFIWTRPRLRLSKEDAKVLECVAPARSVLGVWSFVRFANIGSREDQLANSIVLHAIRADTQRKMLDEVKYPPIRKETYDRREDLRAYQQSLESAKPREVSEAALAEILRRDVIMAPPGEVPKSVIDAVRGQLSRWSPPGR